MRPGTFHDHTKELTNQNTIFYTYRVLIIMDKKPNEK